MATNTSIAENLKRYFYTGIGLASHASELLQKSMDEYVKTGRVSESDGKKMMSDVLKKIEERRSAVEDKYNEALHKFISLSATEIAGLQKKVEKLEDQLKAKGSHTGGSARIVSAPASAARSAAKKTVKAVKKAVSAIKKK